MLAVAIILSVVAYLLVGAVAVGLWSRYDDDDLTEGMEVGLILFWPLVVVFLGSVVIAGGLFVVIAGGLLEIVGLVGGKHSEAPQEIRTLNEEMQQLREEMQQLRDREKR